MGIGGVSPAGAPQVEPLRQVESTVDAQQISAGTHLIAGPQLGSTPVAHAEFSVHIVARRHTDGRIEFALQQRRAGGDWGERLLPARRFFPSHADVGRWLASTPLTLSTESVLTSEQTTDLQLRVVVRRNADGRTEFALQRRGAGGDWGERLLPTRRFFSTDAKELRWLKSATVSLTVSPVSERFIALSAGDSHACSLRTDHTIRFWGSNEHGEATPPPGEFASVTAGSQRSCSLRATPPSPAGAACRSCLQRMG